MTRSAARRAPVASLSLVLLQTVMLAATLVQPAEAQRGWPAVTRRFDAFAEVARHHYGFADRATGRRVGDSTVFHWASVTKTLTAIAVLQLRDRGLLSLDDPITRWVPELREPTQWSQLVAMMPYQRLEFAPGSRYWVLQRRLHLSGARGREDQR